MPFNNRYNAATNAQARAILQARIAADPLAHMMKVRAQLKAKKAANGTVLGKLRKALGIVRKNNRKIVKLKLKNANELKKANENVRFNSLNSRFAGEGVRGFTAVNPRAIYSRYRGTMS